MVATQPTHTAKIKMNAAATARDLKDNLESQEAVRVAAASLRAQIKEKLLDVIDSLEAQAIHALEEKAVRIEDEGGDGRDSYDDGSSVELFKGFEERLPEVLEKTLSEFMRSRLAKVIEHGCTDAAKLLLTLPAHVLNLNSFDMVSISILRGSLGAVQLLVPLDDASPDYMTSAFSKIWWIKYACERGGRHGPEDSTLSPDLSAACCYFTGKSYGTA